MRTFGTGEQESRTSFCTHLPPETKAVIWQGQQLMLLSWALSYFTIRSLMDEITKLWTDNPARAVINHSPGAAVKLLLGWGGALVCVLQASKAPHAPSPGIIANLVWLWVLKWNFQIQQVIHSGVCICLKDSRQKRFLCSNEKEEQTEDRALSMQILQGRQEPNQGIHYDEII